MYGYNMQPQFEPMAGVLMSDPVNPVTHNPSIDSSNLYRTMNPQTDPMLIQYSTNVVQNSPTLNQVNRGGKPYIDIVEQPRSRGLRFRYKCEGRSAGTIPGETSTNEHRTYPTIKICNYSGPSAIVVVSCVTKDDPPRPHPHSLVGKDCKQGVCTVKLKGTTTVSFPSLGIQCATKREVQEALKQREKIRVDPWGTGYFKNTNNVELSTVRLAFQAFLPDSNGKYTQIVQPTVSHCIFDKKAVTDLVICRLSKQSGSVRGGDEVFLLCEKVTKDDIQIRFFEEVKDEGVVWEKYGLFGQQDVHRQVAIVFKTPEYKDQSISHPVTVMVQLRRPSDDEFSDPKPFQFIPNDPDPDFVVRKRKRKTVNFDNFLKDYKVPPYAVPVKAPVQSTKETIKERLIQKADRNRTKRISTDQHAGGTFTLPQYSLDNTGSHITDLQHASNVYHMSPDQQNQWAAMQTVSNSGQVNVIAQENHPYEGNMTQLTSVVMDQDGTVSDRKTSEIFTMLRESNTEGLTATGINSIPSLPSAVFDALIPNTSVGENLAILTEQNVAAEETVESMNDDSQMQAISQSQYTNMNPM